MIFCGVDPGASGGFGIIDENGLLQQTGQFTGWEAAARMLREVKQHEHLVILEKIHAVAGDARRVNSIFAFGKNVGGWEALLEVLGISHILVGVQSWQPKILGKFKAGQSKEAALAYVARRYPDLNLKKSHTGIADALCLALYGKLYR